MTDKTPGSVYDGDYFLRGKESGKSLYEDYRWLPDLTVPMCQAIIDHLGARRGETFLDFGCARGYTVKAMRQLGYGCEGVDVSEWAIANADPEAFPYVRCRETPGGEYDWILAKDVLEHVSGVEQTVIELQSYSRKGVFAVVPLSYRKGECYVVPEYEQDVTHLHRLPLETWAAMFLRPGWSVTAQYRVKGVKDNYAQHDWGNGFITARRIS